MKGKFTTLDQAALPLSMGEKQSQLETSEKALAEMKEIERRHAGNLMELRIDSHTVIRATPERMKYLKRHYRLTDKTDNNTLSQ